MIEGHRLCMDNKEGLLCRQPECNKIQQTTFKNFTKLIQIKIKENEEKNILRPSYRKVLKKDEGICTSLVT